MNVVYSTDNGYAMQLGISMMSLLKNNQNLMELNLIVLDAGIQEDNIRYLIKIADYYRRSLKFIPLNRVEDCFPVPLDAHGFNSIVFARLLLGDLIDSSIDSVLYLDCDTVVNGSIAELEQLSCVMGDKLIAAVPELYMPPRTKKKSIGFKKYDTYYNAGVLLVNLKVWRKENLLDRFVSFYSKHRKSLLYNDQDVINACCKGRIMKLPMKYNISGNHPWFPLWYLRIIQPAYFEGLQSKEISWMIKYPVIVHYLGDERPWIHGNFNYYRILFLNYKKHSYWRKQPDIRGKERYMRIYHYMNICTKAFPLARTIITNLIGIHFYQWFGKAA